MKPRRSLLCFLQTSLILVSRSFPLNILTNSRPTGGTWPLATTCLDAAAAPQHLDGVVSRRNWWISSLAAFGVLTSGVQSSTADDEASVVEIEMKNFVDPVGYFSIRIPKNYFALRRSSKGDLPDPKTGQGRRGSSIFTAGDLQKAEVVAVERFPTRLLLEENGIEATGELSTFPQLGDKSAIANLLNLRRERDKPGMSSTAIIPDSIYVTSDGKELGFTLKTEIEVQKPELLMEQEGVSQLFRITLGKASLRSNDGNIMAVFASALETDFNGPDGKALQEAVDSFMASDQSAALTNSS